MLTSDDSDMRLTPNNIRLNSAKVDDFFIRTQHSSA